MKQIRPSIPAASAVIFDVDGTLVDSVDFHVEAWQRAFSAFGFDFDLPKVRQQIGRGGYQLLPLFLDGEVLENWSGRQLSAISDGHNLPFDTRRRRAKNHGLILSAPLRKARPGGPSQGSTAP